MTRRSLFARMAAGLAMIALPWRMQAAKENRTAIRLGVRTEGGEVIDLALRDDSVACPVRIPGATAWVTYMESFAAPSGNPWTLVVRNMDNALEFYAADRQWFGVMPIVLEDAA